MKKGKRKTKEKTKRVTDLATAYAHRGFHSKPDIPENSMPAFRRAIEHGMASELDVHLISDGTLVVFHDDDLERETGVKGSIEDYDYKKLSKLRLEGTDEKIPTFDEVLDLYEDSGLPLLIELKVVKGNHKALAAAVCKRLKKYKGNFAIQSFYPRVIREVKKLMPGAAVGQLCKNYFNRGDGALMVRTAMLGNFLANLFVKPDFVSYKLNDRQNKRLHKTINKKGLAKAAWTVRSPEALLKAIKAGSIPIFEGFDPSDYEAGEEAKHKE